MLAKKIITREKFLDFLQKTFINKNDVTSLMSLFFYVRDVDLLEKAMFVLYNEYVSADEILACVSTTSENNPDGINIDTQRTQIVNNLKTLIQSIGLNFYERNTVTNELEDVSYKYMRQYFFRDYVTTLTYENYCDNSNMTDQLYVIYESLTADEKEFLQTELNINRFNFSRLVRMQENDSVINKSKFESYEDMSELSGKCLGNLETGDTLLSLGATYSYTEGNQTKTHTVANGDFYYVKDTGTYGGISAKRYQYIYLTEGEYKCTEYLPIRALSDVLNNTNPSITTYDLLGNATVVTNNDYYLSGKSEKSTDTIVSKRDCLISILNKISQGTIH